MDKQAIAQAAILAGKKALDWVQTDEGKRFICGTYTDGTPRSLQDAWNDEIMSPATREKRMKDLENRRRELERLITGEKPKKKKKKKKSKNKKKKKSNDLNDFSNDFWISYF